MANPARRAQHIRAILGRGLWLAAVLLLCLYPVGIQARDGTTRDAETVVTLWVSDEAVRGVPSSTNATPGSEDADAHAREKLNKITQLAAQRLRTRLKAARIKDVAVTTGTARTIVVRARGSVSRELLAGIVVPQGDFALRPVLEVGQRWLGVLDHLPEGVSLRQDSASLDQADAFLWSKSPRPLQAAIRATAPHLNLGDDVALLPYPSAGGWRTLALGAPVATHADLQSASIRQGQAGDHFVQLGFSHDLSAGYAAPGTVPGTAQRWALVLDGEVVAVLVHSPDSLKSALSVAPPAQLASRDAQLQWAQQVAGRLAAYMPIQLVESGPHGALIPAR